MHVDYVHHYRHYVVISKIISLLCVWCVQQGYTFPPAVSIGHKIANSRNTFHHTAAPPPPPAVDDLLFVIIIFFYSLRLLLLLLLPLNKIK